MSGIPGGVGNANAAVNRAVAAIHADLVSTVSTETAVACANADTALLAANPLRKNFVIYNPVGSTNLHLQVAAGAATAASYFLVPPGTYYDNAGERWQGPVRGFWDAGAAGNCLVREVT